MILFFYYLYRGYGCIQWGSDCSYFGCCPFILALTFWLLQLSKAHLRKAAQKNAATQSLLVEALKVYKLLKRKMQKILFAGVGNEVIPSFMSESFRSLLIGISTGTTGNFLNQLSSLITLWVGAYLVIQGELTIGQSNCLPYYFRLCCRAID